MTSRVRAAACRPWLVTWRRQPRAFVCCAEPDDLSVLAPKLFDALIFPKEFVRFATADGAGAHCETGARTLFHQRVFGWLDGVLAPTDAAEAHPASSRAELLAGRFG
jgi:hypothetical protein